MPAPRDRSPVTPPRQTITDAVRLHPLEPVMLLALILVTAGLAPGITAGWYVHRRHGWPLAILAGLSATTCLPFLLLTALIVFPPLGFAIGVGAAVAAVRAYDEGRVWIATMLAATAMVALSCAGMAVR